MFIWWIEIITVTLHSQNGTGFSAVGSAHVWGARGRWFESSNPDSKQDKRLIFNRLFAFMAQSVGQKSDTNIMGWLLR